MHCRCLKLGAEQLDGPQQRRRRFRLALVQHQLLHVPHLRRGGACVRGAKHRGGQGRRRRQASRLHSCGGQRGGGVVLAAGDQEVAQLLCREGERARGAVSLMCCSLACPHTRRETRLAAVHHVHDPRVVGLPAGAGPQAQRVHDSDHPVVAPQEQDAHPGRARLASHSTRPRVLHQVAGRLQRVALPEGEAAPHCRRTSRRTRGGT